MSSRSRNTLIIILGCLLVICVAVLIYPTTKRFKITAAQKELLQLCQAQEKYKDENGDYVQEGNLSSAFEYSDAKHRSLT